MRRAAVIVTSVLGAPGFAWAQPPSWESCGMHHMWGLWGIGMLLLMFPFWGAVIAGIVVAIRWLMHQGRGSRSDSALDILQECYARGEIDREEFLARKRDL
ncbi:MAG: SHOCT domain-containing protein [bacterium]